MRPLNAMSITTSPTTANCWNSVTSRRATSLVKCGSMLEDLLPHRERIAEHQQALLPSVHWDGSRRQVGFLGEADEKARCNYGRMSWTARNTCRSTVRRSKRKMSSRVSRALRSGWLTHGPVCREFEAEFAAHVGASRAVALSSCTAASTWPWSLRISAPGDEVITTPFTFCASAHVIEHVGATPVFADIDPVTMQIDPAQIELVLGPRTKAIIAVDYGGHPCPIEEIVKMARARGVAVIEDAAHSLGAAVGDRPIGSIADVTAFSFYATKNITTGEGGMLTTADHQLADRVERLRLHGIEQDAWRRYQQVASWHYEVSEAGFKANMTDFQAALGRSQLRREPAMRARRTAIAKPLLRRLRRPRRPSGAAHRQGRRALRLASVPAAPGRRSPEHARPARRWTSTASASGPAFTLSRCI